MEQDNSKFAVVTIVGICIFVSVMFIAFPFIQPELEPMKRFGSEYVVGRYGWLMRVAFYSFAVGLVGFVIAVSKSLDPEIRSPVALVPFSIGSAGILFSGIFDTELLVRSTLPPPEWTEPAILPWTHHAHKAAGVIAFLAMVPAIGLITWRLHKGRRLSGIYSLLRVLAVLLPIVFVLFAAWSIEAGYAGFGQRLFLTLFFAWMLLACFGIVTGSFQTDRRVSEPLT